MRRIYCWPTDERPGLEGLGAAVAGRLGAEAVQLDSLGALAEIRDGGDGGERDALLAVAAPVDGADTAQTVADLVADLQRLPGGADQLDIALVVPDSFLGTDEDDTAWAVAGAAAVSTARSLAVRRESSTRANVVAVPAALLGRPTVLRGPLRHEVGVEDVAEAASFVLGEEASYLTGQVLWVNAGRQLFSSLTA